MVGGPGSGNFGHEGRPGLVGGSGDGGGTSRSGAGFDRKTWTSMSMQDRRAAWDKMSVKDRDAMANARTSIVAREKELLAPLGKWQNSGDVENDVISRIAAAKDEMSATSLDKVGYTAMTYGDALRDAGVDADTRATLLCNATDILIAQEMESQNRQLGDHGISHILGDIDRAYQISGVLPYKETPAQKAEMMTALIYHDAGYMTEPSQIFLDEGHPRWSAQNYDENIGALATSAFGKDAAAEISYNIRSHDSMEINWKEDPVGSSIRVSDNTALFEADKLPGVFKEVPGTYDSLVAMNAGTVSLEDTKANMLVDINNAKISDSVKERYTNAVNEMTSYTPTATLGMKGGEIYDIAYQEDHVVITLTANDQNTQDQKLLDLGQAQFAKFAKSYGVDPKEFTKSLDFTFQQNGKVLLEGKIKNPDQTLVATYSAPIDNRQVVK